MNPDSKTAHALAAAALAAACFFVFAPVAGFEFVDIDDPVHFVRNEQYRGLGAEQLRWMFLEHHGSAGYDPLAWLTYAIDWELQGLAPGRWHVTGLLFYVTCILIFQRVVLRVISIVNDGGPAGWPALLAATGAAALFALHPLRVESVAWLSERHGVLATIFALLSTHQYLRIRSTGPAHLEARNAWALSLLFFALALLSKSTVIFLPIALLVLDVAPLRRLGWPLSRTELHDRLVEKLPFFALSLGVGLLTIEARAYHGMWSSAEHFGLGERVSQSLLGLAYYVAKTFAPFDLTPLQLRVEWQAHHASAYAWAAVGVAGAAAALFALRRRLPEWGVGFVLYAILLLPVLGLLQSGPLVVADRYTLLGMAPLFAALALSIDRLLRSTSTRGGVLVVIAVVFVAVLAAEASATRRQLAHWRDASALWSHMFAVTSEPALMSQNRGALRMQGGDHAGAARDFEVALEGRPDDVGLLNMAGQNAAALGRDDVALTLLDRLIEAHPDADGAYRARARIRLRTGDLDGAARDLETYLRIRPGVEEAERELDAVRAMRARRTAPARRSTR